MKQISIHVSFHNDVSDTEARTVVDRIVTGIQNDLILSGPDSFAHGCPTEVKAGVAVLRVEPRT